MLNKTRSDSRLGQLSPEKQAELYRRLKSQTYAAVQQWLALPPPDGFGLKTHINSLYRFLHRYELNLSFTQTMTAALAPAHPHLPHHIRLAAVEETGRLIATNRNARAVYSLFSKQFFKADLAECSRARRALAREQRQSSRLRKPVSVRSGEADNTPRHSRPVRTRSVNSPGVEA